jgi:hypothetical protein
MLCYVISLYYVGLDRFNIGILERKLDSIDSIAVEFAMFSNFSTCRLRRVETQRETTNVSSASKKR